MDDEININITSVNVQAQPRKLRANWQPEPAQDFQAFNAFKSEPESLYKRELIIEKYEFKWENLELDLEKALVDELTKSIDAEIIRSLLNNFNYEI